MARKDAHGGTVAGALADDQKQTADSGTGWLDARELAELAGISPQAGRDAIRRGFNGGTWRGASLAVRLKVGRGGNAGMAYEVAADSLPEHLRTALNTIEQFTPTLPAPRSAAANQSDTIALRWAAIREACAHPQQSAERAAIVAASAARVGRDKRTLYRWIKQHETHGLRGLARAAAANTHDARIIVSRVFDRAARDAGYGDDVLRDIATCVQRSLKGLWASRAEQAGSTEIRRLAEFLLFEACEARGVAVDRGAMTLSRRGVEQFAHFRVVNRRRNDRKAFDDAKPRIRRDWTALAPMERIVADVKHLDVIVRRSDGSPAWPKIVGFMDVGTGRVFVYPVLLNICEGVRQETVIEAFLAMASHPGWGFPLGLYLDNGAEFAALVRIEAALNSINEQGVRTIIFAKPYNASAKPIESLFARLDRYVFSMLPGYAGPNRMAKKTQTVGKPPKPFPGTWEEFCSLVEGLVGAYHHQPIGGLWAGRSPNTWFEEKIAAGWRPSTVDLLLLDVAFCTHDSRRLDRGVVKINGERFSHPKITQLASRTVVDLALPWRRDARPLARAHGGEWVRLTKDIPIPGRWIEGAKESSARQNAQSRHVSSLQKEAPVIDPVATKIRWARAQATPPSPPPGARIDLGEQLSNISAPLQATDADVTAPTKAELRRAREMALTEELERELRRGE